MSWSTTSSHLWPGNGSVQQPSIAYTRPTHCEYSLCLSDSLPRRRATVRATRI